MEKVFLLFFNMGLTATWIVLAVIAVRALCHKAPRALLVGLWALVGVRLICPVLVESITSLIPSAEIVSPDILIAERPTIHTGVTMLNSTVNPIISEHLAPEFSVSSVPAPGASVNPMQVVAFAASVVWIAGVAVMFAYSLGSYILLRHKVKVSLCYRDNIYFCDTIATPFVFGFIKPRIYLPSGMAEEQMEHVIAHEAAHLKRKDHWWKTIAFFLLSVYWFNPLLWLAYMLFSRDIERACDEKVIREMDNEAKKGYAETLVSCSLQKRMMFACPLAFGEVGVKNRVKSILNYKKPAFWIVAVTVVAGLVVTLCFLTNPISDSKEPDKNADSLAIIGSADGPTAVLVGEETLWKVKTELPDYMSGSNEEGLYVFIWQLAANSYSCGVLEKTEKGYTNGELWSMKSMRMADARRVVESYGFPRENVTIIPYFMPYSSYLNLEAQEDPEGYRKKLEALFWEE